MEEHPAKLTGKEKKRLKQESKRIARTEGLRLEKELQKAAEEVRGALGEIDFPIPASLAPHLERIDANRIRIKTATGLAQSMKTDAVIYANSALLPQLLEEFANRSGFLPAIQQLANVASIDGIVGHSIGMPDAHSGYGFCIGGVGAVDMDDPKAVVCPGGIGYDINCGVRLIRTNLHESQISAEVKGQLADELFRRIPVGVGSESDIVVSKQSLDELLLLGLGWAVDQGFAWPEDLECCEEGGCITFADPSKVSKRAKAKGISQIGTLGSGNHYIEVQAVEEIFDANAAEKMGLNEVGRICIMIHSGSRGMGNQICTDALQVMQDKGIANPNDKQLTGVPIQSEEGKDYLAAMAAGANYAFVNRGVMTHHTREAFAKVFGGSAKSLGMNLVYDVCHNIAKVEEHVVNGVKKRLLVHRKGATRAFPPNHPMVPEKYREIGQPVIIGGSMGTSSYVLTGTQAAMDQTFGSTCHGAGRSLSRSEAMKELTVTEVMESLRKRGVLLKIATPSMVAEEAPEAYKDVSEVIHTCQDAGISKLCVRLRPLIVVKG